MLNASMLSDEDILDPHRPHVTLEMQVQALTTELHQTTKALAASQADAARAKSALARLQGATVKGMTDTQLAALESEVRAVSGDRAAKLGRLETARTRRRARPGTK